MASFASTVPVHEHVVSIDNSDEDTSKARFEVAPKEVHIMSFERFPMFACLGIRRVRRTASCY